jgi:hypothetical protein
MNISHGDSFDHKQWLRDFEIASKNHSGFKELRADIFRDTVAFVQAGGYQIDGKHIPILNDNVTQNSGYFDAPAAV